MLRLKYQKLKGGFTEDDQDTIYLTEKICKRIRECHEQLKHLPGFTGQLLASDPDQLTQNGPTPEGTTWTLPSGMTQRGLKKGKPKKGSSKSPKAKKRKKFKRSRSTSAGESDTAKKQRSESHPLSQSDEPANAKAKVTGRPVKATLVGVNSGPCKLGVVDLPTNIVKKDTDTTGLCVKSILTCDNEGQPNPLLLGYTASWGPELILKGHTPPTTVVSSLKMQLDRDHDIHHHIEGTPTELANLMTLIINVTKAEDNERVGPKMQLRATDDDPFPNEVMIEVEDRDPPTLSHQETKTLKSTCHKATFMCGEGIPNYPCVYEIPGVRNKGIHGLPIIILEGDEKAPCLAIVIPPVKHVTREHDRMDQIYTNLVALFLKKCAANDVKVKVKYEDNPGQAYMVHPNNIRLYQDCNTRADDLKVLKKHNYLAGCTFKPRVRGKTKTPGLTRHWQEFLFPGVHDVSNCGDLHMCRTEIGNGFEVAWKKNDEVKYGDIKHEDIEISDETLAEWWKRSSQPSNPW